MINDAAWTTNYEDLRELFGNGERLAKLKQTCEQVLLPEGWNGNVLQIRQNLRLRCSKCYKFIIDGYKRSVKELASFSLKPLPDDMEGKIKCTDDILEGSRLTVSLAELEALAVKVNGKES